MAETVQLEPIIINPVEELLKGIAIVRGPAVAQVYRDFVWKLQDMMVAKAENNYGAGI